VLCSGDGCFPRSSCTYDDVKSRDEEAADVRIELPGASNAAEDSISELFCFDDEECSMGRAEGVSRLSLYATKWIPLT